ncbi:hypothetical protein JI747_008230 [Chryseobacterium sp. RG1]|uniref:Lipoprotein n=1 Tax=Chryseobacterium tagetis TaxID=2801334 RepID=A0ABS7ZZL0_9FLAO|nr:hypothetical protein [Chryseobacterium tagetis]MCA6067162.1 hypothetical protein [Chryseobacterium tagetis]
MKRFFVDLKFLEKIRMNKSLLVLIVLLISCKKKKTFADNIALSFPKDNNISIQKFNEDTNEMGSNLLYKGEILPKIEVKYFKDIFPEPPPPPRSNESEKDYAERIKRLNDSINHVIDPYFRSEELKILDTEEYLIDSLSNKNLSIIVKEKDTIPLYKMDYDTREIKIHKAYPVYIKNISSKVLKIPIEASHVEQYVFNNKEFQYIRNSNNMICGTTLGPKHYFQLIPNEIMIYAVPYFKKGSKRKAKIVFFKAYSKEFEIPVDEKIIQNQRSTRYLK